MRIIIAGQHVQAAYQPLLNAGHRVLAMARTIPALRAHIRMEQPEGILIRGLLGYAASELADGLQTLPVPVVLLLAPDEVTPDLKAVATVLPLHTPWAEAAAALTEAEAPAPEPPPKEPAKRRAPVQASERQARLAEPAVELLLYPVVGGAGATTLALTLAAAAAKDGIKSLVASVDQLAILARLGAVADGQPQRVTTRLYVTSLSRERHVAANFPLAVWEIGTGYLKDDTWLRQAPLVILTRPTGEGRLTAVRAVHTLRRRGADVRAVVVARRGGLTGAEFERHCRGEDAHFPAVYGLPEDPQVPMLEDVTGHALDAPLYGPTVARMARQVLPDLPWPVEEEAEDTASGRTWGAHSIGRRLPIQIELTE